jgi:UDP-glucose 4-epimerase
MNIGIIGGLGFIGTNLYKLLIKKKKYKISIIDNLRVKNNVNYFKHKIINFDVSKDKKLNTILKNFDVVINLAGQTGVLESFDKPNYSIKNNIISFSNIINALQNSKCKVLINASTGGAIYGESKKNCNENHPKNPRSIYGLTKKFNEDYTSILSHKLKFNIIHLRFANVFGEFSFHKQSLIHKTIKNCLLDQTTNIFGDGTQKRNFIYVNDLTKIIEKCFKISSGTYNVSSPKSYTVKEFIKMIKNIYPYGKFKYFNFNKGEVKIVNISNNKLKKKLKLKDNNFTKFQKAVIQTSNWYLENLKKKIKNPPKITK